MSFAEGHFADAASHARLALSGFTASGRESDRYQAAAILAGALMSNGRTAEASALLAQFLPPYPAKFPARSVVQLEIAQCFLLAHTGRRGEAMRAIDAVIATAARRGIRRLERDSSRLKRDWKDSSKQGRVANSTCLTPSVEEGEEVPSVLVQRRSHSAMMD